MRRYAANSSMAVQQAGDPVPSSMVNRKLISNKNLTRNGKQYQDIIIVNGLIIIANTIPLLIFYNSCGFHSPFHTFALCINTFLIFPTGLLSFWVPTPDALDACLLISYELPLLNATASLIW